MLLEAQKCPGELLRAVVLFWLHEAVQEALACIILTCLVMSQENFREKAGESRKENWGKPAEFCPVSISSVPVSIAAFSVGLGNCLGLSLGGWLVRVGVQSLTATSRATWPDNCTQLLTSGLVQVCSLSVWCVKSRQVRILPLTALKRDV